MLVKELHLTDFKSHASRSFVFPLTGVVLITGSSGAGKSSVVQAIQWTAYGKMGNRVIATGKKSAHARLVLSNGEIQRTRTMSGNTTASAKFGDDTDWRTPTFAQKAIDAHLPFDLSSWEKLLTFSEDTGQTGFAGARSDDQFRIIESIGDIGGVIRRAHDHVRAQSATLNADASLAFTEMNAAQSAVTHYTRMSKENTYELQAKIAGCKLAEDFLTYVWEKTRELADGFKRTCDLHDISTAPARAGITCPTCGRDGMVTPEAAKLNKERYELLRATRVLEKACERLRDRERRAVYNAGDTESTLAIVRRANDGMIESSFERALSRGAELEKTRARLEVLNAAYNVLSSSGVRSHIIRSVLSDISEITNQYMSVVYPAVRVNFGIDESGKSVVCQLHGHPKGVALLEDASRGERRRVQIATMFAMSTFARGQTMFLDEIADGVDRENISRVAAAINDVAANRCVVVITHNPNLVDALSPFVAARFNL